MAVLHNTAWRVNNDGALEECMLEMPEFIGFQTCSIGIST